MSVESDKIFRRRAVLSGGVILLIGGLMLCSGNPALMCVGGLFTLVGLLIAGVLVWDYRADAYYRLQLRRSSSNQCIHCGYDLRSGHDRCPECGSELPRADF